MESKLDLEGIKKGGFEKIKEEIGTYHQPNIS
jgi:hypothetical protein